MIPPRSIAPYWSPSEHSSLVEPSRSVNSRVTVPVGSSTTIARYPSRPCQVVMQASLPSGSASTQNAGASAS
jgi:hypothetical protein